MSDPDVRFDEEIIYVVVPNGGSLEDVARAAIKMASEVTTPVTIRHGQIIMEIRSFYKPERVAYELKVRLDAAVAVQLQITAEISRQR